MDAQSLHNHIQSSTKRRIHAKPVADNPENQIIKNEEAINSELHKEEFDQDGDGVVSLMEELNSIDNVKEIAEHAAEKLNESNKEDEENNNSNDNENKEQLHEDEELPQAAILTEHEVRRPGFNAFSSHHASAPVPRQIHHAPVEEAKPVKDNTSGIIMVLLIAILIIAVAIFGVIVLGEYRREQQTSQIRSPLDNASNNEKKEKTKTFDYDFSSIIGEWGSAADTKACLIIDSESKVSWYNNCEQSEDGYYSGTANIISGQDAVDKLGITREKAARILAVSASDLNIDQTFSIIIKPSKYVVSGNNKAEKPSEIALLLTKTSEKELNVYSFQNVELTVLNLNEDNKQQ